MLVVSCKGKSLQKRNPVTLYNSNSLFHRPRKASRQLSTAKPMVVAADPMALLAIREQTMGGSVPVCLSVVALFGPLFDFVSMNMSLKSTWVALNKQTH
jgi:hypothetical protein